MAIPATNPSHASGFYKQGGGGERAIQNLLNKKVIYKVPLQPCLLSHIFLVPKPSGEKRLIINLRRLNKYIYAPRFHIDAASIGGVYRPPRRLFSHSYQTNSPQISSFSAQRNLYFFRALPFGLNVAPYIFTRVLRYPLSILHQQGIPVIAYLDDWIVWGKSPEETSHYISETLKTLQSLGFLINQSKSQFHPSSETDWLGVRWYTQSGLWGIPTKKKTGMCNSGGPKNKKTFSYY